MTGGQTVVVRNLLNGNQTSSMPANGLADHAVWSVPDLKESVPPAPRPGALQHAGGVHLSLSSS